MHWDLFCRVIDNWGDIGVCWRLAARLGALGHRVRLWLDDDRALPWLAPHGAHGVEVRPWPADDTPLPEPGEVVVEAFGCDPPPAFVAAMARAAAAGRPPVWINLEYLSAEPYVERSHGLASPQWHGPGAGLTKFFFYPGFTPRTGGLIHGDIDEAALAPAMLQPWLAERGWAAADGERALLLFAYRADALPALLDRLQAIPGWQRLLLRVACSGGLQAAVRAALGGARPGLRVIDLPPLPQTDFDRLLAASDLNLVRGEDSFARAQLVSPAPALWQIYVQDDGAHAAKLEAWMACAGLPPAARDLQRAWNDLAPLPPADTDPRRVGDWSQAAAAHHRRLRAAPCLVTQLGDFVTARRAAAAGVTAPR